MGVAIGQIINGGASSSALRGELLPNGARNQPKPVNILPPYYVQGEIKALELLGIIPWLPWEWMGRRPPKPVETKSQPPVENRPKTLTVDAARKPKALGPVSKEQTDQIEDTDGRLAVERIMYLRGGVEKELTHSTETSKINFLPKYIPTLIIEAKSESRFVSISRVATGLGLNKWVREKVKSSPEDIAWVKRMSRTHNFVKALLQDPKIKELCEHEQTELPTPSLAGETNLSQASTVNTPNRTTDGDVVIAHEQLQIMSSDKKEEPIVTSIETNPAQIHRRKQGPNYFRADRLTGEITSNVFPDEDDLTITYLYKYLRDPVENKNHNIRIKITPEIIEKITIVTQKAKEYINVAAQETQNANDEIARELGKSGKAVINGTFAKQCLERFVRGNSEHAYAKGLLEGGHVILLLKVF